MIDSKITYTDDDGSKKVFVFHEELGHGGFAVVYRVTLQNTNKNYAMKVISKEKYTGTRGINSIEKLKNEIKIQKSLNHPNIVQLKYSFSDDFNYYIVLEYCPGKSIRSHLRESENGHLSEPEVRKILTDIIQGLIYLQNNQIVHHDLKLENFLIGSNGDVKIADFGLASRVKYDRRSSSSVCGTTSYLSPELLHAGNKYQGFEADIWAVGVATFYMLTGKSPFDGGSKEITFENIRKCNYYFPSKVHLSYESKDFIKTIFQIDPRQRATAIDLIDHPFLTKFGDCDEHVQLYKPPQTIQKVRKITTTRQNAFTPAQANYNFARVRTNFRRSKSTSQRKPTLYNLNDNVRPKAAHFDDDIKPINFFNTKLTKSFNVPANFVAMHYFRNYDLGYMFSDGTVGACFEDHSRIVMDPNEEFVQYYKDYNCGHEVFYVDSCEKHSKKISFVRKLAKSFKKIGSLYEVTRKYFDTTVPLNNVKYFLRRDDAALFRFENKDIQACFNDNKKLIIFWNSKKMCVFSDFKEKCQLMDLKDVSAMNPNCDVRLRFHSAKEMLNLLSRKISE